MVPPAGSSPLGAIGRGWTYLENKSDVYMIQLIILVSYVILVIINKSASIDIS